jgi:hypothetical protein
LIDRFGVPAVFGRPYLGASEINKILVAQNIVTTFQSSEQSADWAEWASENKEDAIELGKAMKAAEERGYLDDG